MIRFGFRDKGVPKHQERRGNDDFWSIGGLVPNTEAKSFGNKFPKHWNHGRLIAVNPMEYEVFITFEDGWYIADIPALPGCMSQGRTEKEAIKNAKDAIKGYLDALRKNGRPVPKAKVIKVTAG